MKALIVDDDLALADIIAFTMRHAGYEVIMAHDGQKALDRWRTESPDLIILDLNLPKLDGMAVCQQIRALSDTPIIILSVRGEEEDVVKGLKLGADDYMVKPFSPRQLVARAEAVLRRSNVQQISLAPLTVGDWMLDPARKELYYGDRLAARLTKLENKLLEILIFNRNQVVFFDTLIDNIWGPAGGDRIMLKQLVYRLRRKIDNGLAEKLNLETVPGVGYSLNAKPG